jgi:hypothetical protein
LKKKPPILSREEALALVCALIMTMILCVYMVYLKQQEFAGQVIVSLSEYDESFSIPADRPRSPQHPVAKARQGDSRPHGGLIVPITSDSISASMNRGAAALPLPSLSDSLGASIRFHQHVDSVEQSAVFRRFTPSRELDAILKIPGEAGIALLREHVIHESLPYDTALMNHMIRLSKELTQTDLYETLEGQMKFNIGRYGSAYNPLRPQPPSAQVPVKPIVLTVLGFLYTQAKEVSAAVTRVVKPRVKEPPE